MIGNSQKTTRIIDLKRQVLKLRQENTAPDGPGTNYSGVAQSAERLAVNQDVAGSSPAPGANPARPNLAGLT